MFVMRLCLIGRSEGYTQSLTNMICIYISAINENNSHEFEADQGSIYGKIWKEVKVWLYYNLSK